MLGNVLFLNLSVGYKGVPRGENSLNCSLWCVHFYVCILPFNKKFPLRKQNKREGHLIPLLNSQSLIPWCIQGTGQALDGFFLPPDELVQKTFRASYKWASAFFLLLWCTWHTKTVLINRLKLHTVIAMLQTCKMNIYNAPCRGRLRICFAI